MREGSSLPLLWLTFVMYFNAHSAEFISAATTSSALFLFGEYVTRYAYSAPAPFVLSREPAERSKGRLHLIRELKRGKEFDAVFKASDPGSRISNLPPRRSVLTSRIP